MKENGAIRKKTKNPSTGRGVHTQGHERSNHDMWLDVIEKPRKVKEEYATDTIGGDAIPSFKTKKGGGVRSREEFAGVELSWTQKVVTEVEGTEASGDDFLKKFAMTFE